MPAKVDPLITAVQRLTSKHVEAQQMPGETRLHYATHDPLLQQLRDAIKGDIGGTGGATQLPSQRSPIDPDALDKYLAIVVRIRDFHALYAGTNIPMDESPELTLTRAFVAYQNAARAGKVEKLIEKSTLRIFESMCAQIEEKLFTPTQLELYVADDDNGAGATKAATCPECGMSSYTVVINKDRTTKDRTKAWYEKEHHATTLVAIYRPDGQGGLSRAYVRCGCCESIWFGSNGIRYIAHEINRPTLLDEIENRVDASTPGDPNAHHNHP